RAERDLGLAEADVAADDAVHRLVALQVVEHLLDRRELVVGLLERKLEREALVALVVELVANAAARGAFRVEVQQLGRDVARLLRGLALGLRPLIRAEAVQRRMLRVRARVARDEMQVVHGHVELVAARVFQHEELGQYAVDLEGLQTLITADAVILVDDRSADAQIGQLADDRFRIARLPAAALALLPRPLHAELLGRQHAQLRTRQSQPFLELAYRDAEPLVALDEGRP